MRNEQRPISALTLVARLNRILDQDRQAIFERPLLERKKWGRYPFGVGYHKIGFGDGDKLEVLEYEVDIEALGHKLGALTALECLEPKREGDA
jgi:hypothetical protein